MRKPKETTKRLTPKGNTKRRETAIPSENTKKTKPWKIPKEKSEGEN